MTIQERTRANRIKKRNRIVNRRIILLIATLFVITLGSVVFGTIFSKAKNPSTDTTQYKYYKSITIEQGDSLWNIAEEYCTDTYKDMREYIAEVKELNALTSDTIHEGQHLLVVYYDEELH